MIIDEDVKQIRCHPDDLLDIIHNVCKYEESVRQMGFKFVRDIEVIEDITLKDPVIIKQNSYYISGSGTTPW